MSRLDDLEDPILIDCPGTGGDGNLSDGWAANCQFCNKRLTVVDSGTIPAHQTPDIIAMIARGDFTPTSKLNRSRS